MPLRAVRRGPTPRERPTAAQAAHGSRAHDGLRLQSQAMRDGTLLADEAQNPIIDRMLDLVSGSVVMQIEHAPVMCQAGRGGPNLQAYPWTFVNPHLDAVVDRLPAGRASQLPADAMRGFRGNSAATNKVGPSLVVAGCWAHVTRKFRDAEKVASGSAELLCMTIQRFYEVEHESDAR
jgi:hypothetical protein